MRAGPHFAIGRWPAGPGTWLERRSKLAGRHEPAFMDLNYDGVFSYFTGQDVATLRIVHMVVDGEQRERLVHLNGVPREIIRRGDEVTRVLMPGDNLVELSRGIASGPFARAFTAPFDRVRRSTPFPTLGSVVSPGVGRNALP